MKRLTPLILLLLMATPVMAYEGFGKNVTGHLAGGGGYDTYDVDLLTDTLPNGVQGELRHALQAGNRLIEFSVGGTITMSNAVLSIANSYTTIDGSTAPSPGITIVVPLGPPEYSFQVYNNGAAITEIIVNNLRFEGNATTHPDTSGSDIMALQGVTAYGISNVVFDHITASGAQDGAFDTKGDLEYITISNCFIYEAHTVTIISGSSAGYTVDKLTYWKNLWTRCNERQPLYEWRVTNHNFVNNVVYGWGYFADNDGGIFIYRPVADHPNIEFIKNYYKFVNWGIYALNGENNGIRLYNAETGNVTFTDNIFHDDETDDVSYGTPTVISAEYRPTELAAAGLGDSMVPYVGTHYPTQAELVLLNEVSLGIGGAGVSSAKYFFGKNVRKKPLEEKDAVMVAKVKK